MEALQAWLVGCSKAELRELLPLMHVSGATRYAQPCARMTHVVVGSSARLTSREVAAASAVLSRGGHIVAPGWLRRCAERRDLLPPLDDEALDLAALRERAAPGPSIAGGGRGVVGAPVRKSLPTGKDGVFRGMRFAVLESEGSKEAKQAQDLVRMGGGELMLEGISRVSGRTAFAVCPAHAPLSRPNVLPADKDRQVTSYWLERCLRDSTLHLPGSHVLFQPLAWELPLDGADSKVLTSSLYPDDTKLEIERLAELLGMKFNSAMKKGQTTHLLVPQAEERKYAAALRWGIYIVTVGWLYECARQGRMVAEGEFPTMTPGAAEAPPAMKLVVPKEEAEPESLPQQMRSPARRPSQLELKRSPQSRPRSSERARARGGARGRTGAGIGSQEICKSSLRPASQSGAQAGKETGAQLLDRLAEGLQQAAAPGAAGGGSTAAKTERSAAAQKEKAKEKVLAAVRRSKDTMPPPQERPGGGAGAGAGATNPLGELNCSQRVVYDAPDAPVRRSKRARVVSSSQDYQVLVDAVAKGEQARGDKPGKAEDTLKELGLL